MGDSTRHPDANALVERLQSLYGSCKAYSDRGQVTSILPREEGDQLIHYQTFSTAFVRPDKFRFEFRDRFPEGQFGRYVVWREGALVKTWWYAHNPTVKVEEALGLGLAGATGVSHGAAVTIPQLLMPKEVGARGLFEDTSAEVVGSEECQGRDCVKIQTVGSSGHFVWVEMASGLVVRIEERTQISYQTSGFIRKMTVGTGALDSWTIISYKPEIDTEILPAELEFGAHFAGYGDDVEVLS